MFLLKLLQGKHLDSSANLVVAKQPADVLVSDYIIKHPEKFFIKEKMSMN